MYLDNERFKSKFREHKLEGIDFDLKTLCYSCYTQGLVDAMNYLVMILINYSYDKTRDFRWQ